MHSICVIRIVFEGHIITEWLKFSRANNKTEGSAIELKLDMEDPTMIYARKVLSRI